MTRTLLVLLALGGLATAAYSVLPEGSDSARRPSEMPSGLDLARLYCARCHLLPDPGDLPRESWPFVIEWMANYLGHRNTRGPFAAIVDERLIPPVTELSDLHIEKIRNYYVENAPGASDAPPPPARLDGFAPHLPLTAVPPGTVVPLLRLDTESRRLYVGTAYPPALRIFSAEGAAILDSPMPSAPVFVEPDRESFRLTLMGDFDRDRARGQVLDIMRDGNRLRARPILQDYHRLVQARTADLDGDGRSDLLAVGFGDYTDGRVSVLWQDGHATEEQILIRRAGAVASEIRDLDGDGLLDVLLLVAQANPELVLFRNTGNRSFERRSLLRRRPGFGYNHLLLSDVDGDGRIDIVTSNGNNMELPDPPVRPYHGIRILLNRGALRFTEASFIPFPGALRTVAGDFDGDGDDDLASIAFYPDWSSDSPETFVYLENDGAGRFTRRRPADLPWGRWLSIDSADLDGDGRTDILLGSGALSAGIPDRLKSRWERRIAGAPSVVALLNRIPRTR